MIKGQLPNMPAEQCAQMATEYDKVLKELQAGAPGHVEVGDDGVVVAAVVGGHGLVAVGGRVHVVPGAPQVVGQGDGDGPLVVGQEYAHGLDASTTPLGSSEGGIVRPAGRFPALRTGRGVGRRPVLRR